MNITHAIDCACINDRVRRNAQRNIDELTRLIKSGQTVRIGVYGIALDTDALKTLRGHFKGIITELDKED